jgi:hypothetical protein
MKTLSGRQYSFQQVTQFSQGDKVQDTPASNTLYCAIRYKCFSILCEAGIFHKVNDSLTSKCFQISNIPLTS